uniref:Leucine rich immune protein (Coil-less) n=1 Tax=Anopheles epiroticus TaxID=199890 RepID=A0A182PQH6_9DIPT
MTGWNVPFLMELSLQNNNLTRIPIGIEKHPNLTTLLLANNLLSVVDLRRLEGWDILQTIDLAGNRIRNVMITGSGRLTLPGLKRVDLSNNQLARLEFVRWDFPKLSSMALAFNRFQRFPNLWKMFPELGNVIAFQNPLLCEAVRNLQQLISTMRLIVDASGFGTPCTTNATFTLQSGRVICCVE